MKILINRQPKRTPWGGGTHFVTLLTDYLMARGHMVVHSFSYGIEAILMIDPRPEDGINDVNRIKAYKLLNPKVKVIHRINDSDPPRNTNFLDKLNIDANLEVADHTIFISQWLKDHYISKGFDSNRTNSVITNGCDLSTFVPVEKPPLSDRKLRVVTHHWSDNFMKGFDAYIGIDKFLQSSDQFEFTYVGRYFRDYKPLKTKVIAPLYGKELAAEIAKHDVYITGARFEACGMHHVEAAACGLPVLFHSDGGGVVEMCERYGRRYDSQSISLLKELEEIVKHLPMYQQYTSDFRDTLSSESMCKKYADLLEAK